MDGYKGKLQRESGAKRACWIVPFCWAVVFTAVAPQAKGAFIGDYALSNFTLTNTNTNDTGFATVTPGGALVLTGGNGGSGLGPGMTDLTIAARGMGTVFFNYVYSTLDDPGFDFAGYLLSGAFTQLANSDGQSGSVTFPVDVGQIFGFRVATFDNTGEPGILTVSDFTAPSAAGAIPEPGTLSFTLVAAATTIVARRRINRANRGEERIA